MTKRLGGLALTVAAATAVVVLGTATSATAMPGWYVRSHHASLAECEAVGQAGGVWGALYLCRPFVGKPGVYELWVRY
ncbi:hypothetical protein ACWEFL_03900 [Streptomyces sp. NPDC004838]